MLPGRAVVCGGDRRSVGVEGSRREKLYMKDKFGQTYGWGVAQYSTPEAQFGYDFVTSAYCREPEKSRERIIAHLKSVLPDASDEQFMKLIR